MAVILIGGEKGGTGKTTLATNLAAMRAKEGHDVLLLDADMQGSASFWVQLRNEAEVEPAVHSIQKFGKEVRTALRDLKQRYGDVVVDAGGRDSKELRAALLVADRMFSPIQASQFDVWTLSQMAKLVEEAREFNEGLEAFVLINRGSPNPVVKETGEAREYMAGFEDLHLAETVIRERIAFRYAAREGRAVVELSAHADTKAKAEMEAFYREVFE